ncbi:MAG TPA: hypothetical protein VFA18_19185 [Gemmataceae bacterium]|nr:hypothetical protein [Gemmataceae bacterium]
MSSIVLHSRSGPDSKLHLEVPVDRPNTEFEVEVVIRPKAKSATTQAEYTARVEGLAGTWQGDFERPPQGEFEQRESLS